MEWRIAAQQQSRKGISSGCASACAARAANCCRLLRSCCVSSSAARDQQHDTRCARRDAWPLPATCGAHTCCPKHAVRNMRTCTHLLREVVVAVGNGHVLHHVTRVQDVAARDGDAHAQQRARALAHGRRRQLHALQQLGGRGRRQLQAEAAVDEGQRHLQLPRRQVGIHCSSSTDRQSARRCERARHVSARASRMVPTTRSQPDDCCVQPRCTRAQPIASPWSRACAPGHNDAHRGSAQSCRSPPPAPPQTAPRSTLKTWPPRC